MDNYKPSEVGEYQRDIKTTQIMMKCPKCTGDMNWVMYNEFWTGYKHKCNKCGHKQRYTRIFPHLRYTFVEGN